MGITGEDRRYPRTQCRGALRCSACRRALRHALWPSVYQNPVDLLDTLHRQVPVGPDTLGRRLHGHGPQHRTSRRTFDQVLQLRGQFPRRQNRGCGCAAPALPHQDHHRPLQTGGGLGHTTGIRSRGCKPLTGPGPAFEIVDAFLDRTRIHPVRGRGGAGFRPGARKSLSQVGNGIADFTVASAARHRLFGTLECFQRLGRKALRGRTHPAEGITQLSDCLGGAAAAAQRCFNRAQFAGKPGNRRAVETVAVCGATVGGGSGRLGPSVAALNEYVGAARRNAYFLPDFKGAPGNANGHFLRRKLQRIRRLVESLHHPGLPGDLPTGTGPHNFGGKLVGKPYHSDPFT